MRHSDLKNDLHYAKLKTFTGNPATITPDFFDQILTATDTNKVYRATGTNQGQLVELSPPPVLPEQRVLFDQTFPDPQSQTQLLVRVDQNRIYRANGILPTDWLEIVGADGGGSGGGSSAISVGTNPPQNAPDLLGQQYFDSRNGHLFIAIADGGGLSWKNSTPPIKVYSNGFDTPDLSMYSAVTGDWTWYYIDFQLLGPETVYFDSYSALNVGSDLESAIAQYGAGCYAAYYDLQDPNGEISSWEFGTQTYFALPVSGGTPQYSNAPPDYSGYTIQAVINGRNTSGFYFSPTRRFGWQISYSGVVNIY